MLYNDPKLIVTHVPKTGGSSLAHHLYAYQAVGCFKERDGRFDNHVPLQTIVDAGININDYVLLSTKRNTWERLASFYRMCLPSGNFPVVWNANFRGKRNVSFSVFYNFITPETRYCEDYFYYLGVDGEFPQHLQWLNFNNLEKDAMVFCESLGLPKIEDNFPKLKVRKVNHADKLKLLHDPKFIEVIGNKYQKEIEYFGFEPPRLS